MNNINPPFPKNIRHGGRLWKRKESGTPGYDSEDGNFSILLGNGYVVLVAFEYDPIDDAEFWRKRFSTAKQAMEFAEQM